MYRGKIRRFFGIGLIEIYLIGSILLVPVFENRKKSSISLHPIVHDSLRTFFATGPGYDHSV